MSGSADAKDGPQRKRDLPGLPHRLFNDLLTLLVNFYKEHLQRETDTGRLAPADGWVMLRGFLVAAMQTYASICILVADNRPKRLMLQAAVLSRSLFEILSTVVALTEDLGRRSEVLGREAFKNFALRHKYWEERYGSDPKWTAYIAESREQLDVLAKKIGLPTALADDPASIKDKWPTPGAMLRRPKRNIPAFVSGSRHAALKEIYGSHYSHLSAQAHGRVAAMAVAMLVDEPSLQWNPGYGESDIILVALLFMACILSEIESAGGFGHHPKLAELWSYLREAHDEGKELWHLRYEELST